jgi:hypothetical protein
MGVLGSAGFGVLFEIGWRDRLNKGPALTGPASIRFLIFELVPRSRRSTTGATSASGNCRPEVLSHLERRVARIAAAKHDADRGTIELAIQKADGGRKGGARRRRPFEPMESSRRNAGIPEGGRPRSIREQGQRGRRHRCSPRATTCEKQGSSEVDSAILSIRERTRATARSMSVGTGAERVAGALSPSQRARPEARIALWTSRRSRVRLSRPRGSCM